jgi:hypothetical protein
VVEESKEERIKKSVQDVRDPQMETNNESGTNDFKNIN